MTTSNAKGRITRRGFFERSAGVLATAGILGGIGAAKAVPDSDKNGDVAKNDSAPMTGKIALEEHFAFPDPAATYPIPSITGLRKVGPSLGK
jgi:hypothetical protein